jgi:hypothetical protein
MFKIAYNVPNLKDVTILDEIENPVFVVDSTTRAGYDGGDIKVDADSNGNVTLKDNASPTSNEIFTTVPNSVNITAAADLIAALADVAKASVIIDGDITIASSETITLAGYKKIQGQGKITFASGSELSVPEDTVLVLDNNVGIDFEDGANGGNSGKIIVLSGGSYTDNVNNVKSWAYRNNEGGSIVVYPGAKVYQQDVFKVGTGTGGHVVINEGTVVITKDTLEAHGNITIDNDINVIQDEVVVDGILTIAAGKTLAISATGVLNLSGGIVEGAADGALVVIAVGGQVTTSRFGFIAETVASSDKTYTYTAATGIWTAA